MSTHSAPPQHPEKEILQIFELLKPYAKGKIIKPKVKIHLSAKGNISEKKLVMLAEGKAALYRRGDNLLVSNIKPITIYGLADIFVPYDAYYLKAQTTCKIYTLTTQEVIRILESKNAWRMITILLSHYVQKFVHRDYIMVGNTSYDLIKSCIYEYDVLPEELKLEMSLSNYIQNKTTLSRSLVMKILLNLKTGGYIEIKKGRLVKLHKLPHHY